MACASGAASIALGADLVRAGVTVDRAGGRRRRADPHLLHGLQRAQAARSRPRAVPSIAIGAACRSARPPRSSSSRTPSTAGRAAAASTRELAGYGMTTDAHHVTAPHPEGEGMIRAMRQALDAAGLDARDVGYVNAHGTGTPQNDRIEALALAPRLRRGRRAGQLHQVDDRPHDGGGGQRGGGRHDPGARSTGCCRRPRISSRSTPTVPFDCLPGVARRPRSRPRSPTPSASAART